MDESESYFDFSGDDQTFYEIEAIAALSFLAGILRNILRFEHSRKPLTV